MIVDDRASRGLVALDGPSTKPPQCRTITDVLLLGELDELHSTSLAYLYVFVILWHHFLAYALTNSEHGEWME